MKMRIVEIGSTVVCNHEKVKVVNEYKENAVSYLVLETSNGLRSIPSTKIMWNGKNHFVTADGYAIGNMVADAEKIIRGIKNEMKIWDGENSNPVGFHREEAIDACFMEWLRNDAASHDNEALGFIVRKLVVELEEI